MRKNILIFGHNYGPQFIDIYNQYTRLFDKTNYCVTVAYLTGAPNETVRDRTIAEDVLFLNCSKSSIRYLKLKPIQRLLRLCREKNFHQVICHRYKPAYIMAWVTQFKFIPSLIFVMHELGTMRSLGRRLLAFLFRKKPIIYAGVSNAVRDDLRQSLPHLPHERVVTLYNMIDVNLTEPQLLSRQKARSLLQQPEAVFLFGHVARLVPNKDQKNLIAAFARIKPHCPNAKLIIIGSGTLADELKNQVHHTGLHQDVIFTGQLTNGFSYMPAFDCFVLSSLQEAFGRVLLEAMIAKCPIIATRTHGIPEVVGNAGELVPAQDTSALANAMQTMYAHSQTERERMGQVAYQHMVNHFSIPVFHQHFWQLPFSKE